MERAVRALRYAALEGELATSFRVDLARDDGSSGAFEAVVAEIVRMTNNEGTGPPRAPKRVRDGSKTAARLEDRMRRRAERMALDAVRHQELIDNRELRQARSLSRRWFVLGRAFDAALASDEKNAAALRAAIAPFVTRPDERALLGWGEEEENSAA